MTPNAAHVDRCFERFRRTGDPAALGAVFDAVADDLFVVALRLSPDRAAAEDLLQSTFLVAIQRRQRWDPTRPLRPWLFGILDKEARRWRRRVRHAVGRGALPNDAEGAPAWLALLRGEAASEVARAIAALPEPYRAVAELRLLHDLPCAAIAERLGRSPGSVRTQLWRALERLRATLPLGLVPAVAIALPTPALATVRDRVLTTAGALAHTPALAGGVLVHITVKSALVAVVVLAVGGATWRWLGGERTELATRPLAAAAPAAPLAAVETPPSTARALAAAPAHPAAPHEPDTDALAAELAALRGLAVPGGIYAALRERFERDEPGTAELCRRLLGDMLAKERCTSSEVAAVLAAWLDHGVPAAGVLREALAALADEHDDGPASPYRRSAFPLALGLCMRSQLPAMAPAVQRALTTALVEAAAASQLSRSRGAAIAMALQSIGVEDEASTAALLRLGNSPIHEVRGSARTALEYRLSPSGLVAAFERPPRPIAARADQLDEVSMLWALSTAADRHPSERDVLRAWIAARLAVLRTGTCTEPMPGGELPERVWLRELLGKIDARDVAALRGPLERLAAEDPESAPAVRRLLDPK